MQNTVGCENTQVPFLLCHKSRGMGTLASQQDIAQGIVNGFHVNGEIALLLGRRGL